MQKLYEKKGDLEFHCLKKFLLFTICNQHVHLMVRKMRNNYVQESGKIMVKIRWTRRNRKISSAFQGHPYNFPNKAKKIEKVKEKERKSVCEREIGRYIIWLQVFCNKISFMSALYYHF